MLTNTGMNSRQEASGHTKPSSLHIKTLTEDSKDLALEHSELLCEGKKVENSENDDDLHLSRRRWGVLLCYCIATISANSSLFAFTSISNLTQEYYGVSMAAVNWLSIVYSVMLIPLAIPYSYATNRFGLRFILIFMAIIDFTGTIVRYAGQGHNGYIFLLIGCLLSASASAGILQQPPKIASVWFGESERALATGIGVAMDATGMAVGFLQSSLFIGKTGNGQVESEHFNKLLLTQCMIGFASLLFALILAKDKPNTPPTWSQAFADDLMIQDRITEKCDELDTEAEKTHHSPFHNTNSSPRKSYWGDIISLLRNSQFLLIIHLHAIVSSLDTTFLTFLNELLVPKFPKQVFNIGIMGACTKLASGVGNLAIGIVIDRTKNLKVCAFIIFSSTTTFCIIFILLYYCDGELSEMSIALWLLELVMTCYYTVAFEQSAEATFPVSESAFSALLIMSREFYSFILTAVGTALLSNFGAFSIFVIIYLLSFTGVIGTYFLKDLNIRSYFDQRGNNDLVN